MKGISRVAVWVRIYDDDGGFYERQADASFPATQGAAAKIRIATLLNHLMGILVPAVVDADVELFDIDEEADS